jgi:hypothetical protein
VPLTKKRFFSNLFGALFSFLRDTEPRGAATK